MRYEAISVLRRMLLRLGYCSAPMTTTGELTTLLARLRPFETDKPLIRIGATHDGGYLIPDDLEGIEYCFSPGVSTTAAFEEDLLTRGVRSFLTDGSVDGPPPSLREFVFDKKFLASFESDTHVTLSGWVNQHLPWHTGDLLLQMDIEGAEYPVLLETPREVLKRFRILTIEFHHLDQLLNRRMFGLLSAVFFKLLQDFTIVHLHPNNASGVIHCGPIRLPHLLEITFLRHDRIAEKRPAQAIPHALDRRNIPARDDLALPDCWLR
jgi:hypothetical protein